MDPEQVSAPQEPASPQQQRDAAAADSARGFQLATNAYVLDQLDIRDPARPREPAPEPRREDPRAPAAGATVPGASAAAPVVTDEQLRRAAAAGIPADEARAYDPVSLERTIALVSRSRAAAPAYDPYAPIPLAPPPEEPEDPYRLPSLRDVTWPAGATDEQGRPIAGQPYFDERLVQAIEARDEYHRRLLDEQRQTIDEMRSQFGQVAQAAQAQRDQTIDRQFEAAFGRAADQFDALGRGTLAQVGVHTPAGQARAQVVGMTYHIEQTLGLPFEAAFDRACRLVCGEPAAGAAPVRPSFGAAPERDPGTGRFLARPTHSRNGSSARAPSPADREANALAYLTRRGREVGLFGDN